MGALEQGFSNAVGAEWLRENLLETPLLKPAVSTGLSALPRIALEFHSRLADIEDEWRGFEKLADCTAFQSFDWIAKWQLHIGALKRTTPAIVIGRDSAGGILFLLPLAIEQGRLARRLTWLGSELCDYNAPLLAPGFTRAAGSAFPALWRGIVGRLRKTPPFRFDVIDLSKMPETLGIQANPFVQLKTLPNPSGAYVATLTGDWEQFYAAKRSSSTRKTERKQFRQLGEHGEVRFVESDNRADVIRTLDVLMTQKSQSLLRMGAEDIFARPGYRAFYGDVATDGSGLINVNRLDVGSVTAATNMGLRFRGRYYLVLTSYDHGDISRCGPGRAHLHELLRRTIGRGFAFFDFTIGDEPYKRDWSDIVLKLHDHLDAVTLRGAMAQASAFVFRKAKRFIKRTPVLWDAFLKLRALAARTPGK